MSKQVAAPVTLSGSVTAVSARNRAYGETATTRTFGNGDRVDVVITAGRHTWVIIAADGSAWSAMPADVFGATR